MDCFFFNPQDEYMYKFLVITLKKTRFLNFFFRVNEKIFIFSQKYTFLMQGEKLLIKKFCFAVLKKIN